MRKIQHYNWDLSKIYKTETEFEEEIQYVRELNEKLKALGEDIKGNFKSYLETMTEEEFINLELTLIENMTKILDKPMAKKSA